MVARAEEEARAHAARLGRLAERLEVALELALLAWFWVTPIVYGFMTFSSPLFGQPNHYYVQGVGYATIMDILRGERTPDLRLFAA